MDALKLACVCAAASTGALLIGVTAGPVHANGLAGPVTITAHRYAETRVVPFGDLSLTTDMGRKMLIHRVSVAVREVCPAYDPTYNDYDETGCRDFAWGGARPQMDRAFSAAVSGEPLSMNIEITAAAR